MTSNVAVEAVPVSATASPLPDHLPEHPANPRSTALIPYVDPGTFVLTFFNEVRVIRPPVDVFRESDHSGGSFLDDALTDSSEHGLLETVSGEAVFQDLHVSGPPSKARRKTDPSNGSSPRSSAAVSEGSVVVVSGGAGGVRGINHSLRTKLKPIKRALLTDEALLEMDGTQAISWLWEQGAQHDGNVRFRAHSADARERRHLGATPRATLRHRHRAISFQGSPSEQLVRDSFSFPLQREQAPLKKVRTSRSRPSGATHSFLARPVIGGLMRLLHLPWVSSWKEDN